jgi:hypothetical protein
VLNAIPATAGSVSDSYIVDVSASKLTGSRTIPKGTMPAGSVLQVVQASYSTQSTTASTSFVSTGLTTSITPTSTTSKVLAMVTVADPYVSTNGVNFCFTIYRNSTNINPAGTGVINALGIIWSGSAGGVQSNQFFQVLDSPATTSSTSYTLYFANYQATGTTGINWNSNPSTITLMEIAA